MNKRISIILIIALINYYLTKGIYRYLGIFIWFFISLVIYFNNSKKNKIEKKNEKSIFEFIKNKIEKKDEKSIFEFIKNKIEKKDELPIFIFILPISYYLLHSLFFTILNNKNINLNMYLKEFVFVLLPIIIIKTIDKTIDKNPSKIINYLFYSVICAFFIQSFILNFDYIIANIGNKNRSFGLFENHILTQALVYFLFYYIYIKDNRKALISLIFIILGNKRVVYIGFILCLAPLLILKIKNISQSIKSILISIYLISVQLIYVVLIKSGILQQVFSFLKIDDKWRFAIWSSFFDDFKFNIGFPGNGVGYVYDKLQIIGNPWYPYLYNEQLKYMIELGIVGFIIFSILRNIILFYVKNSLNYRYFTFVVLSISFSIGVVFMDNLNFYQEYLFLFYGVIYFSYKEYMLSQKEYKNSI